MGVAGRSPWQVPDLVVVLVLNGLGVVAIIAGAVWAEGLPDVGRQFPAANLTVAGLLVAGFGNIAWLLTGRRAVSHRRAGLLADEGPDR